MTRQQLNRILPYMFAPVFIVLFFVPVLGQEINFVYPSSFEDQEGEGLSGTGFGASRSQQVHLGGETFSGLPETHRWITGVRMRPDASVTSPGTRIWQDFQMRLSTTNQGPGSLSRTFADNVGSDETLVYDGTLTLSTNNAGPLEGPRDFDLAIDFVTPFYYDPSQGNLLIDFTWNRPFSIMPLDTCCATGDTVMEWMTTRSGFPADESASIGGLGGSIYQFVFSPVPEPSSAVLGITAVLGFLTLRRRQYRSFQ